MTATESVKDKASILVVDDNPLIINVVRSLLASQGYQVFTCANGAEALGVLDKKTVDVIVCDVMMPEIDGYGLHEKVRANTTLAHIPFIFLTALDDREEVLKGHEAGADDYIVKPFEPRELLSVVKGKVVRSHYLKNISEQRYESYRKNVIHTLSHEFRTPLVAINTGTELLIDQKANLDNKKVVGLLEAIRRGGLRLEKLVNDFMLLQQLEAGIQQRMYDNRASVVDCGDLILNVLESEREAIEKEGFVLTHNFVNHGVKVKVYEPHIQDIISRLLSNAVKFAGEKKEIEVVLYTQEQEVVIEIRDRGIGFDVNKIKEAIDVFGQIDRARLEQQGGGLGLAIANRYVAINRGRLDFEQRSGGGSIVSVILPLDCH